MQEMIRVVAVDIDGTLAGADHRVSLRSIEALKSLQLQGVTPVIVTGRTERAALIIARAAGLDSPTISCNGAIVTAGVDGARLREAKFSHEVIQQLMGWTSQRPQLELILWTPEQMLAERRTPSTRLLKEINMQEVDYGSLSEVNTDSIVKIMIAGSATVLDSLAPVLEAQFSFVHRSLDTFVEGSAPGASKEESLELVLNTLGVRAAECLGIADGDTDIGWLSLVGEPVAVQNARPGVLAVAGRVIGHHADEAVATFLEERFGLT